MNFIETKDWQLRKWGHQKNKTFKKKRSLETV